MPRPCRLRVTLRAGHDAGLHRWRATGNFRADHTYFSAGAGRLSGAGARCQARAGTPCPYSRRGLGLSHTRARLARAARLAPGRAERYRLATYWLPVAPGWLSWRALPRREHV